MKAILVKNEYTTTQQQTPVAVPAVRVFADSSILPSARHMPLFVPETPPEWESTIHPALVVSRLGRNIAPRFASRYCNAFTLICVTAPVQSECYDAHTDIMRCMDNAIVTGRPIAIDPERAPEEIKTHITLTLSDGTVRTVDDTIRPSDTTVARTIADISHWCTIKNGDIIICPRPLLRFTPQVGSHLQASIDGMDCLTVKIR